MVSQSAESSKAATPLLLGCGVVAGPLYLAVGLAQALTRDGFDLARHPLSILANGPGGWIQVANLALTGLMVVAASVGIGRTVPKSRVATWALAVYGLGMVVSAVFRADPMDGFPPGTPEGMPTAISTAGRQRARPGLDDAPRRPRRPRAPLARERPHRPRGLLRRHGAAAGGLGHLGGGRDGLGLALGRFLHPAATRLS